jgi:hypothetical protein
VSLVVHLTFNLVRTSSGKQRLNMNLRFRFICAGNLLEDYFFPPNSSTTRRLKYVMMSSQMSITANVLSLPCPLELLGRCLLF